MAVYGNYTIEVQKKITRPGRMSGRHSFKANALTHSALWAALTLTAYINALYNERVYGKEEQAT